MESENVDSRSNETSSESRRHWKSAALCLAAAILVYFVIAYVLMPLVWKRYERRHPWVDQMPGVTQTASGIPGDPLNLVLVGTEAEVRKILATAGWHAADALGLLSDARIAVDTVLKRPYEQAPVSRLYLFGRVEDLAFEQPVGDDPRRRHHVRFWRWDITTDGNQRSRWLGAVTFDAGVGFSHTTGQITHHIAPDVDAERDRLLEQLRQTQRLQESELIDDFHKMRSGRNGGGDPWHTDGRLALGVIAGGG